MRTYPLQVAGTAVAAWSESFRGPCSFTRLSNRALATGLKGEQS